MIRLNNLSEMLKGILDGMVLHIISRGEIYGYAIARQLRAIGFEGIAEATIYALLLRLEKNGLVYVERKASQMGPPRKFYTLNDRGHEELASFWARWDFLSERIGDLRTDGGEDDDLQQRDAGQD